MRDRKVPWSRVLSFIVFFSFIISTIGVAVLMALAPETSDSPEVRPRSDYVLELLQCVLGIVVMLIPGFLRKKLRIEIPSYMMILYVLFLFGAIVLGEVRQFYYNVPHWDTMLHTLSGAMLSALGFSVINLLNKTDRVPMNLSPVFVAVFTFCFAVALGVVWEIYEFTMDGLFRTNMQKFALEGGADLIGRRALSDTMKDLIVDAVGALAISIVGYISIKFKKGWIERFQLKRLPPDAKETDAQ